MGCLLPHPLIKHSREKGAGSAGAGSSNIPQKRTDIPAVAGLFKPANLLLLRKSGGLDSLANEVNLFGHTTRQFDERIADGAIGRTLRVCAARRRPAGRRKAQIDTLALSCRFATAPDPCLNLSAAV